jgi:hypothetical protein
MNHSFYSVDRTTHLKIVAIALIGATAVAGIGIAAHSSGSDRFAQTDRVSVIKAQTPAMIASDNQSAIR